MFSTHKEADKNEQHLPTEQVGGEYNAHLFKQQYGAGDEDGDTGENRSPAAIAPKTVAVAPASFPEGSSVCHVRLF